MKNEDLVRELETIRGRHGGTLIAEDVVEAATPIGHPLHRYFTWDDSEAAKKFRLWEARELIQVAVTILEKTNEPIRAYVSLRDDRKAGDGYRAIVDVLNDPALRKKLLKQALDEFSAYQERHQKLTELAPLFKTAQRIRVKYVF